MNLAMELRKFKKAGKTKVLEIINILCVIYLLTWIIAPIFSIGMIYRNAALVAFTIWLFTAMLCYGSFFRKITLDMLIALGFAIYTVVVYSITQQVSVIESLFININIIIIIMLFFISMCYYQCNPLALKTLCSYAILITTIFAATSVIGLMNNPYAAKYAGNDYALAVASAKRGIGGYALTYYCVFLAVQLIGYLVNSKALKPKKKWLLRLFVVTLIAFIIMSKFTLAVVILLIGIILVVWARNLTPVKLTLILLLSVSIMLLFESTLKVIMEQLLNISSNYFPYYFTKLNDAYNSLFYSMDNVGTFADRAKVYSESFMAILKAPPWGTYLSASSAVRPGGHSMLLDTFICYGWVYGIIYFYLLGVVPIKKLKGNINTTSIRISYIVMFILLGLLNNYTAMCGVAMFITLPVLSGYFAKAATEKNISNKHEEEGRYASKS